MENLKKWILEQECRNVAMESTGIYWQPIYEILEDGFVGELNVLVVILSKDYITQNYIDERLTIKSQ